VSVRLRAASPEDAAWLGAWLPAVEGYVEETRAERRIIERDGDRAGIAIYRVHAPKRGAAIIELIATPPERARRGSGMRTIALLEDDLRARGVRMLYAPVAAAHGIAMYFWIRLGYRPLPRDAWPCERGGVVWLMRNIDERYMNENQSRTASKTSSP
jgi:GNAT superfamily N-acetyltransferase